MPLLQLEPFVFPDDLFTPDYQADDPESRWWVVHTKPRAEKSVARKLLNSGSPFFLPLHRRTWRCRNRILNSHLPLFPGYVFTRGNENIKSAVFETRLVAKCLSVEDQVKLGDDLARLHQLILSGAPLTPEERLKPGMPVEIISGPLAGIEGKIIRRGNRLRLIVAVQFIQQGASVEVESWMVRPKCRVPADTLATDNEPVGGSVGCSVRSMAIA